MYRTIFQSNDCGSNVMSTWFFLGTMRLVFLTFCAHSLSILPKREGVFGFHFAFLQPSTTSLNHTSQQRQNYRKSWALIRNNTTFKEMSITSDFHSRCVCVSVYLVHLPFIIHIHTLRPKCNSILANPHFPLNQNQCRIDFIGFACSLLHVFGISCIWHTIPKLIPNEFEHIAQYYSDLAVCFFSPFSHSQFTYILRD